MAAVWNFGKFVEPLEEFRHDTVCCFDPFPVQKVKPNGVDVKNGIDGKFEGIQELSALIGEMRLSHCG